ncbi:MAG: FAD:protein FMN transferase [Oscillospiraceae bacterium]|nr:FAD:protein FMN transferase [Oscillospiraceae bacterium]
MKMMFWQKDKSLVVLLILCAVLCFGCSRISVQTETFFAMDTLVKSTVITANDELGRELNSNITEIITEAEERLSKTLESSEIYKLNNRILNFSELSEETAELLNLAETVKHATNGAFDPNLGELIELWGFNDLNDETSERRLPERDEFFPALERLHSENPDSLPFDLGGIGKGYALDLVNAYLEAELIQNALVSFESSILAIGRNPSGDLWNIAVKDPITPDVISGVIYASDKFISVTGGYERYITINGINYIHVLDPETGYPVNNDLLCAAVIMEAGSVSVTPEKRERFIGNGALSDALSTALFVMGRNKAVEFYMDNPFDFEMILFYKSETDPRGYEILATNVNFTEIGR